MCESLVHASFQLEVFGGAIGLESLDMLPDLSHLGECWAVAISAL